MNATLTTRCQELARASRTEYMQEHGGQAPKQGQLAKEIEGFLASDWRELKRAGATAADQEAARECWEESFFQLQTAGGG